MSYENIILGRPGICRDGTRRCSCCCTGVVDDLQAGSVGLDWQTGLLAGKVLFVLCLNLFHNGKSNVAGGGSVVVHGVVVVPGVCLVVPGAVVCTASYR